MPPMLPTCKIVHAALAQCGCLNVICREFCVVHSASCRAEMCGHLRRLAENPRNHWLFVQFVSTSNTHCIRVVLTTFSFRRAQFVWLAAPRWLGAKDPIPQTDDGKTAVQKIFCKSQKIHRKIPKQSTTETMPTTMLRNVVCSTDSQPRSL